MLQSLITWVREPLSCHSYLRFVRVPRIEFLVSDRGAQRTDATVRRFHRRVRRCEPEAAADPFHYTRLSHSIARALVSSSRCTCRGAETGILIKTLMITDDHRNSRARLIPALA